MASSWMSLLRVSEARQLSSFQSALAWVTRRDNEGSQRVEKRQNVVRYRC